MFGRKLFGNILSSILVTIIILIFVSAIFSSIGLMVLSVFLAVGVGIAAIYALIVYVKSFVVAVRELSGCEIHSFWALLKRWVTIILVASKYSFKENMSVASNALAKSGQYRLLSPKRWMWFMVAVAVVVLGTAIVIGVIGLQIMIFLFFAQIIVGALLAYFTIAFLFACFYSVFWSVKNTKKDYIGEMFAFDFTASVELSQFSYAAKQYYIGLWNMIFDIFNENLEIGKSNKSYASNYKIYQPQYVFLFSTLLALPLISILWAIILAVISTLCYVPIVIANLIWLVIAKVMRLRH